MQPESWKFLCTGRWKHRCGRLCLSRLFSCWDTQGRCSVVCFQTWEEGSCISPGCAYKLLVNHVYKVYKCHTEIVFVLWLLSSPVIIPMSQYVKNTKSQTSIARQLTWSVERWLGCGLGMSTDSLWFAGMPGREGKKEREREIFDGTSQDIKWWATSNTWNLELFIQHLSLTKQHSVQKMMLFIQTGFLNSALRSFIFGWKVLPLTKAYKFMTTSEASFFQRWFGVFYWGEEGMYRFCFFIQLEPVKKKCFWGESDYLIVSMIFLLMFTPYLGSKSRLHTCSF